MKAFLERKFRLAENRTDVRTEVTAGVITFMTMAYILVVNPGILSACGMDFDRVFAATAIASAIATLVMGLYANLPFALSSGMGLNAFFSYTVCTGMGYSWRWALTAILVEGIIFLLLTFFNIREAIVNHIPAGLKKAIGAKKKRILLQFLTEAAVLTSLGGIIGVISGIVLAQLISQTNGIPVAISVPAIVISVVFSMLIGIVFGLLPAVKAANLNPIEALRRD